MTSFDSVTMKGRIEDAVNSFLEAVFRPWPAGDPRGSEDRDFVTCCFAETLARLLIGDTFRVVWQEADRESAALSRSDEMSAIALGTEGAHESVGRLRNLSESRQLYAPLDFCWYSVEDRVQAVSISTADAPRVRGHLIILRDGGDSADDWEAFHSYLPGLKILYLTLGAVMQARASAEAAAQRLAFDADVRELVHDRSKDIRERLEQTARLAERLQGGVVTDRLDALERAVVSVLQELLGTGWTVREMSRASEARSAGVEERHLVGRIAQLVSESVDENASGDPAARTPEARRLIGTIKAVTRSLDWLLDPSEGEIQTGELPDRDLPSSEQVVNEPLRLLPLWIRLHELCRPLAGPRNPGDEARRHVDAIWRATVDQTLPLLAQYLEIVAPDSAHNRVKWRRQRPSARNWMRLWFCLTLLREERARSAIGGTGQPLLDVERDGLRAELAFVLRESLRFACFGDRRDFFFQAQSYARSLRLLVEQHAQWIVELPGDYTRRLLHDIAEAGGPNHYLPAEHLQHVLEVYLAGHFLLSVRLKNPGEKESEWRTIAQILSELDGVSRGEPGARTLRQAYSLAALFHDVGHLLFPDPQPGVFLDEPRIKEVLARVQQGLAGAARGLISECVVDLKRADYLRDDAIASWFEAHVNDSEPNHGLLSAWYLMRAGGDGNAALREVLAKAVRAVLLHGVMTIPITKEDPLAALLVLCNEVFEWDPRRPAGPGPGAVGRSFHVMAAEAQREPRDLYLKTQGLTVHIRDAASGTLDAVLDPSAGASGQWPEVHVVLQSPQRLDVPVFWLWLSKAQNLGRIQPIHGIGWAPSVLMKSRVPTMLRHRGLTSRSALELATARIFGLQSIRQWLARRDEFREETKSGGRTADREAAHLRAGGFPLDREDMRKYMRRIRREIENICLEIDAGGQPH